MCAFGSFFCSISLWSRCFATMCLVEKHVAENVRKKVYSMRKCHRYFMARNSLRSVHCLSDELIAFLLIASQNVNKCDNFSSYTILWKLKRADKRLPCNSMRRIDIRLGLKKKGVQYYKIETMP